MNKLAQNLIEYRRNKGLTQSDIAQKVFVSRQAVSKWERAEASPDIDTLIALSLIFEVSVDDLLGLDTKSVVLSDNGETATGANAVAKDVGETDTFVSLKQNRKKENIKVMSLWLMGLVLIYALVCGIAHTALYSVEGMWLIWFTLPVVPILGFALRFRNEIGKKYVPFFFNVSFVSGIIFVACTTGQDSIDGAWIAFLLIPLYYLVAILNFVFEKRKEKQKETEKN